MALGWGDGMAAGGEIAEDQGYARPEVLTWLHRRIVFCVCVIVS